MNSKTLIPVATALVGFALGWGVKSSGQKPIDSASVPQETGGNKGHFSTGGSDSGRNGRPLRPTIPRNTVTPVSPTQDAVVLQQRLERAFREAGSVRDRAKLLRMAEALGLSTEQIDRFDALLAEQRLQPSESTQGLSPKARLEKMAQTAQAFDSKFRAILGPEQTAALDALRARQMENRVESKAQRELADFMGKVDLSQEQREAVADVLRVSAAKDSAKLPAGVDLLMESSYLPSGLGSISDRSVEAMLAIGDDAATAMDPKAVGLMMADQQREKVLSQAKLLEEILTPAQLAQYRAVAEAQSAFQEAGVAVPKP